LRTILSFLGDIWQSILATFLVAIGGFLSMGVLGILLYHLVAPVLNLGFPPLHEWDQSLVWPLVLAMPILWAPAFLPAGIVNRQLRFADWQRWKRILVYLGIIWLAALASWWLLLVLNPTVWR
jgi:hypothetical protein